MKQKLELLPGLLLVLALLLLAGCEDEQKDSPPPHRTVRVSISIPYDTLAYLPGDSVSTVVTVAVTNLASQPLAGVKVRVTLSDTIHAGLVFRDTLRRDTTNAGGRVELFYLAWPMSGSLSNMITATAEGVTDSHSIYLRQSGYESILNVRVDRDHLQLSGIDSAQVRVTLSVSGGRPAEGQVIALTASGGRLDPLPLTDSNGVARTYWHAVTVGQFWIYARYHALTDSAGVTVEP
jgi:hypothetical protein